MTKLLLQTAETTVELGSDLNTSIQAVFEIVLSGLGQAKGMDEKSAHALFLQFENIGDQALLGLTEVEVAPALLTLAYLATAYADSCIGVLRERHGIEFTAALHKTPPPAVC